MACRSTGWGMLRRQLGWQETMDFALDRAGGHAAFAPARSSISSTASGTSHEVSKDRDARRGGDARLD